LGEVAEKLKSYSLSRDVECDENTGYRYIHYGDIHKQIADIITCDEQLPYIKYGNYLSLNQGDLVLADASEDYMGIAEPCVVLYEPSDKIVAGLHTIALRPKNAAPLYLYYLLHTGDFKNFGGQVGTGLKVFGITFNNLSLYETLFPSISEQTAIGNFFRTLDTTITLHQRKLEGLRELKKGYLQQMFPQAGERVPRVRFDGFDGEWEGRRLGDVVDITMGQSPDSANYTNNPNDHILVQGNADMKHGRVSPRVWTTQVTKKAYKGDIIISVRAPVGDVGKTDYDIVLGRGVAGVKGNEFIYQALVKMNMFGYWNGIIQGSTFESIKSYDLKDASIFMPSKSEQRVIGNFFFTIDHQITALATKIERSKELKTAYLQRMFV
jgi:type I restriction enzyme S subunit